MGQELFGIDVSGLIHEAMSDGLVALTLTHYSVGTRDSSDPTAGTNETSTSHSGKGFRESYRDSQVDGTLIEKGDRKISIIGDSITPTVVPAPGDEITIQGETLRIVEGGVSTDPASAVYVCQTRAF